MSDDEDPVDYEADRRIDRQGFNPLIAVGLIVLLGIAAYILFARFA